MVAGQDRKSTTAGAMSVAGAARRRPLGWLGWLGFEAYVSWRFIRLDVPPVAAGLVFAVDAWKVSGQPLSRLPAGLAMSAMYLWAFIYIHALANQAAGVDEDRINKPHRPIPEGVVTVRGAHVRFAVVSLLFLALAAAVGVVVWSLLWFASVLLYNHLGLHRSWIVKNLYAAFGGVVYLAGAWSVVTPLTSLAGAWLTAAFAYATAVFIQDLRDVSGDRANGRRTLPVIIGKTRTRIAGAVVLFALPLLSALPHLRILPSPDVTPVVWTATLVITCWLLAARLLVYRSSRSDDLTYKLYAASFCLFVVGLLCV
ncbi:UbiA family prenyltransferase [Streptomyces sp. NPDC091292]|uniref:UbiA family prenyltransferase n=1 Tax=Streptomyces sp. NPDC091292 TaxID=3365991 RepID=UPI0038259DDE